MVLEGVCMDVGSSGSVPVWVGPVITVASMCQHIADAGGRHRVGVWGIEGLVRDLAGYVEEDGPIVPVPLGGIRMGSFGIVLSGFAAVDVRAIERNIIWEDEHCLACCGALLRFTESLGPYVLVRCGPTIGSKFVTKLTAEAKDAVDEYWTD